MSSLPTALPAVDITPLKGGAVLRWGVMAPGGIADSWVTTVHANTEQRVHAVASRSAERAAAFATKHGIARAYGSYEQLAADPDIDVIYIASPHSEHLALALLAIGAGKHVLVEKPIAVSAAEARQLAAAARAAGVFAMEAMWSRFLPQTSIVAQLLADGALGDIKQVTASFGALFDYQPESRWFNPALAGGALLDIGVYPLWFSQFVLGMPQTVTALGSLAPTGVDAQSVVVLDYPSAAQSIVTMTMWAETSQTATVSGTRARIEYSGEFFAPSGFSLLSGDSRLDWTDPTGFSWGAGLCYQATAVAQAIADGRTESPLHTLDDTIGVLELIDSARAQLGAK
ncbi:MAG: Gfo/Idh/MocA family oxidoreductase [Rhodoglobus sp.]